MPLALSCSQFRQHRRGHHEAKKSRLKEERAPDLSEVAQDRRIDDAEEIQGSVLGEGSRGFDLGPGLFHRARPNAQRNSKPEKTGLQLEA